MLDVLGTYFANTFELFSFPFFLQKGTIPEIFSISCFKDLQLHMTTSGLEESTKMHLQASHSILFALPQHSVSNVSFVRSSKVTNGIGNHE